MSVYRGVRTSDGCRVFVDGGELPPRLDLRNHSPTGFEWGYCGSGPAQLALAILAHHCGPETALHYYQRFKAVVIATLPERWALTGEQVEDELRHLAEQDAWNRRRDKRVSPAPPSQNAEGEPA